MSKTTGVSITKVEVRNDSGQDPIAHLEYPDPECGDLIQLETEGSNAPALMNAGEARLLAKHLNDLADKLEADNPGEG